VGTLSSCQREQASSMAPTSTNLSVYSQLLSAGAGLLDATNVGANAIDMAEKNGHAALSKTLCELVQGKTLSHSLRLDSMSLQGLEL